MLPDEPRRPFVENKILRVLVLAILDGDRHLVPGRRTCASAIVGGFELAGRVIFGVIRLIMWFAPLGAFGGMAFTVAQFGSASLASLGLLMVTFWATCAIFVFVVLGTVARIAGFNILRFIRLIRDELLIIVGTSSSETVLPRLLAKLEAAGASRQTVGLVIPTGYSFNLDGTCIYLTMAALFIVQAAGQDIAIGEQIALLALMILTSKGAAGITGAGLVTLVASLQAFGGQFFTGRVDRRRHRARGRHRPRHERGPRADELHRQRRRDDGDRQVAGRARRRALPGGAARPGDRRHATSSARCAARTSTARRPARRLPGPRPLRAPAATARRC